MADLGTLTLGTFDATNSTDTAITGTQPVLQSIASANDATNVADITNTSHTGVAFFALGDMPSDFGTMDSLSINIRYARQTGTLTNTWNSLAAQVLQADRATALTAERTIASNITTTTPTNSGALAFTGVQAGSKALWDGAVVAIRFTITRNMGGDAIEERVFAASVTGAYTVAAASPNEGTASGSITWVGSATGVAIHEGSSSGAVAWAGSADGAATHQGSATGAVDWVGSATGVAPTGSNEGSASGSIGWVGSADGTTAREGSASGAVDWAGSADGDANHEGSSIGAIGWSGVAVGSTDFEGSAAGSITWTGSATGEAPTEGQNDASASGSITWVGSAVGEAPYEGAVAGNVAWSGSADGVTDREGSVLGAVSWVGVATGVSDPAPTGTRQYPGQPVVSQQHGHIPKVQGRQEL